MSFWATVGAVVVGVFLVLGISVALTFGFIRGAGRLFHEDRDA